MSNKSLETQLKASLTKAIDKWTQSEELITELDIYWGDETTHRMAESAVSILMAIADSRENAQANGVEQ